MQQNSFEKHISAMSSSQDNKKWIDLCLICVCERPLCFQLSPDPTGAPDSFYWASQKTVTTQKDLNNILAFAKPFLAKFRTVKGSLYSHVCTKFGEFMVKFNKMEVCLVHLITRHVTKTG